MRKVLYLFGLLTEADIEWMARTGVQRWVAPGDVLIREGVPVSALILVLEGELGVSVQGAGQVARLEVGEVVGEMSFVDSAPPSATVAALTRTRILALDKTALNRKLDGDVGFGYRFYRALAIFLADRLRGTNRRMSDGAPGALAGEAPLTDELDVNVLDNMSHAGDGFHQLLRLLNAKAAMSER
jgi:CRP-like cAMP-binding protein